MSSKAHILSTNQIEIFEETNSARYALTQFIGFDIVVVIEVYKSVKIIDGLLTIKFSEYMEGFKYFGKQLSIFGGNILEIDIDEDGISIEIIGGSVEAKKMLKLKESHISQ